MQNFELISNKKLTSDVFEIILKGDKELDFKAGQFITFILEGIWGRAYSIAKHEWDTITLLIKRWSSEMGWRWGSLAICDTPEWKILKWVGPIGHFLLTEWPKNRLFLGTWVGLVPLYAMAEELASTDNTNNTKLLFWEKTNSDLFYIEQINQIKEKSHNFDYKVYLSREKSEKYEKWYITNYLTEENIKKYDEFYICWAPAVIDSCTELLKQAWVSEDNIFYEKF